MGQEAQCEVHFERKVSQGKARLEPDMILFRGDFRFSIPLKEIKSVRAEGGQLTVAFPKGSAVFDLGPLAEKWAQKIRNPRGLMDKLGVKPDSKISVVGVKDERFWQQLKERAQDVPRGRPRAESDLIFVLAERKEDLGKLRSLRDYIKKNGAIWVVSPKGKKHIRESDVIAAGKEAGMVDTKVVAFSETHTALKMVIPLAAR